MQSCLNCYYEWECKDRRPSFFKKHYDLEKDIDNPCPKWEDDSVDWDEEE